MQFASEDDQIRAALFRLVDVSPACRSVDDLATHLIAYLEQIPERAPSLGAAIKLGDTAPGRTALGTATAAAVRHMAHRFIVGESPRAALSGIASLWRHGIATSVDLLGEATVTPAEADRYAERCHEALETLAGAAATWPERPWLERDSVGPVPRVNLSVKVTALTPLMRPEAPHLGRDDAAERMRPLLRRARELGAHLHVDMESVDSLETTLELVLGVLAEPEFAPGPSAGVVLQAYLRDSPAQLDRLLEWAEATEREQPLVVRLVKGAYWDQEVVEARQHGWRPPVFERKADCDRNFELLTRRLLDARPLVRVKVGLAQPALGRPRDRLQPPAGRRRRRPRAPGAARARRRARRGAARRAPAGALVLPGRRARRRDGLPGAAAAREHLERLVPARPRPRRPGRGAARGAVSGRRLG